VKFVLDQGVKKSIEITRLINEALGKPTASATEHSEPEASATDDFDASATENDESPPENGQPKLQ